MCDMDCIRWGARVLGEMEVAGKSVIEVGSHDVNGSLRYIAEVLKPGEYLGVDVVEGPGVDMVSTAEELAERVGEDRFDIVLSTCVFEHIRDWKKAISNIKRICKPGGFILFIVPSNWPYHGYPYDFWRYEKEDVKNIFSDCDIQILEEYGKKPGWTLVYAKVEKPRGFVEKDLEGYLLYSIISGGKADRVSEKEWQDFQREHSKRMALKNFRRKIKMFLKNAFGKARP